MGWARVNFNYFIDPKEADFVRRAIVQIASDGWKLLPFYHQNPLTGQYVHRSFKAHDSLRGLSELEFGVGSVRYRTPCQDRKAPTFDAVLFAATDIYRHAAEDGFIVEPLDFEPPASPELLSAIWWPTASDATRLLHRQKARKTLSADFDLREEELDAREHEVKRRELKLAIFKTLHLDRGMDRSYTAKKMDSQAPQAVKFACFPALSAFFPRVGMHGRQQMTQ
jgi:hypothetical protein